jgi:hypothetical protein
MRKGGRHSGSDSFDYSGGRKLTACFELSFILSFKIQIPSHVVNEENA